MIPADFDFRVRLPEPPLSLAVESVWHARGTSPHGRERILPSPAAVLLVVLGPPLRMAPPATDGDPVEIAGAWVTGPHERPVLNEPTGETWVVGASFRPGGVAPFLAGPVERIANRIVPLDDLDTLLGPSDDLIAALRRAGGAGPAMSCLTARLERPLRTCGRAPAELDDEWQAAVRVLARGEPGPVRDVQEATGASRRHFIEQVRRRAGLAPKSLQRIARMRRLLEEIDARKPIRWSAEAVGAGYFDQPHAIRDFKAFTGMTPTQYVERRRRAWGDDVEPGEATGFVPELIR